MSEEESILIDAFLEGTLTPNEQELFLKRMEEDSEFNEHVTFERQLRETLNTDDWSFATNTEHPEVKKNEALFSNPKIKELEDTLKNIANKQTSNNKPKPFIWYSIAAILIISLSVFSIFNAGTSSQELYAQYYNPSELPSLVTRGATEEDIFSAVQQLFEDKKYTQTIKFIKDSLATPTKNKATLMLFQGISYVETEQYANALSTYDKLIDSDLLDAEKGYWFKTLAYLKSGATKNAKEILQTIVQNKYYNYDKAKELLDKLE